MNLENILAFWQQLILYIPLGIVGAWRWSVWLWQKALSFFYRPTPINTKQSRPSLSIVTPVYNEDPELFLSALLSWQRNAPEEIIAVIDATDERCIEVFQSFARHRPGTQLIVTQEPGKRPALARGVAVAKGEIVALVDSDTLWDEHVAEQALAPFADPAVGGVATRQAVIAPKTLAEKLFAIRLDLRYFHEFPYLSVIGDALTCLSGRTAFYRRSALLPCLPELVSEHFLGKLCISGEDKRLTSLLLAHGWKLRYQQGAVVRTPGMQSLPLFFRQNLRWGRNSWRTDFRMLWSTWIWRREKIFAYHLIDRAIQPFTLLLGPIYLGIALSLHHYAIAGIIVSWWMISRTIKIFPHLRLAPLDIFMVPVFAFAQYLLAITKIYALFTLDYQSWITRWHTSRIRTRNFLQLLPARTATLCVLAGMTFFITNYEYSLVQEQANKKVKPEIVYTENFTPFGLDQRVADFWKQRDAHTFGTYVTRLGDTPLLLDRKYNLTDTQSSALFGNALPNDLLQPESSLLFPVDALRNPLPATLATVPIRPLLVTYDPLTDTINVKGKGQVVTLQTIAQTTTIRFHRGLLTETAPKEWLLRSNLYISEGVTLVLKGDEVTWLKLLSTPKKFIRLRAYNGNILIRDTKITSWDETEKAPDENYSDGRASIIAQTNGRMDVINSEIAYLGYSREVELARRVGDKSTGGIYGLSWKIPNGSFGRALLTGMVIGNRIHDNYFGIYTFGVTGMIIRDNEIFNNIQYGIDPHDDSNNLLIENNFVHNNGNHGIIVSKRVTYSTIANNNTRDNRLHGIMLDRQSNYNLVENNLATNNVNGIAIYDSHQNLIRSNTFVGNHFGIRANMNSSGNRFEGNAIRASEKGIFLYGGATQNVIIDNQIRSNIQGVSLKEATGNFVIRSLSLQANTTNLKLDEQARTTNYLQAIR